MGLPKGMRVNKEFQWDFAKDGGAVSSIVLKSVDNSGDLLPEGFLIENFIVVTETALTSGGTPTVTFGNSGSTSGYMVDIWAAMQAANSVRTRGQLDGALIWDTTNDAAISYRIDSTANNQNIVMTVGTAALTAGKIKVVVHGYIPTARDRVA